MYDVYPDQRASGKVKLDGEEILGPSVDLDLLRVRIGMVFQAATMFPMSIFENVALAVKFDRTIVSRDVVHRVEAALTRANLWAEVKDRLSENARSLSGGQQQRLCIARALAVRPEVLLFDEPTGALDPVSMDAVEELMIDLKQDVTIVLVTHNMNQALRCADQVAFFYMGELVEIGPTQQILKSPHETRTRNYVTGKFG